MIEAIFELAYTVLSVPFAYGAGIAAALIMAVLILAVLTEIVGRVV